MDKLKGDLLCAQETHFMTKKQPRCSHKAFPYIFNATAPVKKSGVLIAVKHSVAFKLHEAICDPNCRFIILIWDMNNSTFTLVNLYAPNKGQTSFLRSLLKKVDKVKRGSLLLCGDFNSIVNKTMDCSGPNPTNRQELQPFPTEKNLYDTWRCIHSSEKNFTHYSFLHWAYSRIDLILSDFNLLQRTISVMIHFITWLDHAPV